MKHNKDYCSKPWHNLAKNRYKAQSSTGVNCYFNKHSPAVLDKHNHNVIIDIQATATMLG